MIDSVSSSRTRDVITNSQQKVAQLCRFAATRSSLLLSEGSPGPLSHCRIEKCQRCCCYLLNIGRHITAGRASASGTNVSLACSSELRTTRPLSVCQEPYGRIFIPLPDALHAHINTLASFSFSFPAAHSHIRRPVPRCLC